jgi:hypothetical protein
VRSRTATKKWLALMSIHDSSASDLRELTRGIFGARVKASLSSGGELRHRMAVGGLKFDLGFSVHLRTGERRQRIALPTRVRRRETAGRFARTTGPCITLIFWLAQVRERPRPGKLANSDRRTGGRIRHHCRMPQGCEHATGSVLSFGHIPAERIIERRTRPIDRGTIRVPERAAGHRCQHDHHEPDCTCVAANPVSGSIYGSLSRRMPKR